MAAPKCSKCNRQLSIISHPYPVVGLGSCRIIHCPLCGNIYGVLPNMDMEQEINNLKNQIQQLSHEINRLRRNIQN